MSASFLISINGATAVPSRSLALSFLSLELANMALDVASLQWTRRSASEACPIAHNDTIEIYRTGTRLFRGRARLGATTSSGVPVRVIGPWSHFDEHDVTASLFQSTADTLLGPRIGDTYTQFFPEGSGIPTSVGSIYYVPAGPGITVTWTWGSAYSYTGGALVGTSNIHLNRTTRFYLFKPGGSAGLVYTLLHEQYDQLLAHMAHCYSPDLFTAGIRHLGGPLVPRARMVIDAKMSELIRQTVAMRPSAALWWDYTGSDVPTLNARIASLETPIEVTVGNREGQAMSDYIIAVLHELRPDGVIVRWESSADASTGLGVPLAADIYPAGTSPTAPRILTHTVEETTPYVPGLAQEIYNDLNTLRGQGQLTLRDPDFSLGLRPGRTLSLVGDAQLSGVQLWVQTVSWSPADGLARLTLGYPSHLQLRDRIDLKGWFQFVFNGPHFTTTQLVPPPP